MILGNEPTTPPPPLEELKSCTYCGDACISSLCAYAQSQAEVERLKKNNNAMIKILETNAKSIIPNPKDRRDFRKEFE